MIPALLKAVRDDDAEVRGATSYALGDIVLVESSRATLKGLTLES